MREALILAGGTGSRLGPLTAALPKPLVEVAGAPFIDRLLWNLQRYGIERVVFSLGAHAERLVEHLRSLSMQGLQVTYRVEPEPLGTGGGLAFAGESLTDDEFLLLNGDTLFDFNYLDLALMRRQRHLPMALALRRVPDAQRYGAVTLVGELVVSFCEKALCGAGLVSGGVAVLATSLLGRLPSGPSSLELDLIPLLVGEGLVAGREYDGYFIDIGTPDALATARIELPGWQDKPAVLLDRDGVLNVDRGHVCTPEQFEWMPRAPAAVKWLNDQGFLVFVVTNQAGIAKGYYGAHDYATFERWISDRLVERGAHIDFTFHCPHHPDGQGEYGRVCGCRKPAPGMILKAMATWGLDPHRTVLIGDSVSDIAAARAAGIGGVLLSEGEDIEHAVRRAVVGLR